MLKIFNCLAFFFPVNVYEDGLDIFSNGKQILICQVLREFHFVKLLDGSQGLLFREIVDSDRMGVKLKFPLQETFDFIRIGLFATYGIYYLFLDCLPPS